MTSNAADKRRRNPELPGDPAVKPVIEPGEPELLPLRFGMLQGQVTKWNQRAELYSSLTPVSMEKLKKSTAAEVRLEIGLRVKQLRESLGFSQKEFGDQVEASRGSVAQWEIGTALPRPRNLAKISKLAAPEHKNWWREQAGLEKQEEGIQPMQDVTMVPLYKDRIAAGAGREIEGEIQEELPLPKHWFAPGSKIIALKVEGDSMADLIMEGYYVLIDVSMRDIKRLAGNMVAARSSDGCTVKWLRREESTGFYQLIPHNVSERHPVRTVTPENWERFQILGRVVKWIGFPKPPKIRRHQ